MTTATKPVATPTFFETVRDASNTGVTWLKTNTAKVANRVSEIAKTVANAVVSFFTETCPKYFNLVKDSFTALPANVKYAIGGSAVLAAGYGLYAFLVQGKPAPVVVVAAETPIAAVQVLDPINVVTN